MPDATALMIAGWLIAAGYTPEQSAAVVGHGHQESRLNPASVARSGHIGLFQWAGPRAKRLLAYARERGKPWHDLVTQLEFMDLEWRAMPGSRLFFAAQSHAAASSRFCRHFERRRRCR